MSFKPYTEKIKKKKIGICSILGRIRIHYPGSGSADPDPHQNEADPKHCIKYFLYVFMQAWFCGSSMMYIYN